MKLHLLVNILAGGGELVKPNPSTSVASGVAIVDFADLSFTGVTITARGALIYNTSSANAAVAVLDFTQTKQRLQELLQFSSQHLQLQQLF
jgi:hypothetical protein